MLLALPIEATVTSIAWFGERRQLGRYHHGRGILQLRPRAGRHRDAELLQHVLQALCGERCLRGLVAGAIQAHHQSVADQLVAAHAGHLHQVANLVRARRCGHQQQRERAQDRDGTERMPAPHRGADLCATALCQ
jgi:hypothetical protein